MGQNAYHIIRISGCHSATCTYNKIGCSCQRRCTWGFPTLRIQPRRPCLRSCRCAMATFSPLWDNWSSLGPPHRSVLRGKKGAFLLSGTSKVTCVSRIPENDQHWMNCYCYRLFFCALLLTAQPRLLSCCEFWFHCIWKNVRSCIQRQVLFPRCNTCCTFLSKWSCMVQPVTSGVCGVKESMFLLRRKSIETSECGLFYDKGSSAAYVPQAGWSFGTTSSKLFVCWWQCWAEGRTIALKEVHPEVHDRMCTLVQTFVDDVYITSPTSIHGLHYKQRVCSSSKL